MSGLDSTLNRFPAGAHVHPCLSTGSVSAILRGYLGLSIGGWLRRMVGERWMTGWVIKTVA